MLSTNDLERRLARLERMASMQRYCQALLVGLLLAMGIALGTVCLGVHRPVGSGAAPANVVEARQLSLLDARGRVRPRLAVAPERQAGILVLDESGQLRTALTVDRHGLPRLLFLAERGRVLGAHPAGTTRE